MTLRFTVLASGSAGNASLIETDGFGLLLDAGLGPRLLASRLAAVGASWDSIHAVLLTHTHSDHWSERTFAHLHKRHIPIYCHADHPDTLQDYSSIFVEMQAEKLVHEYEGEQDLILTPGLRCRPLKLRHDSRATYGFRFETESNRDSECLALGYVADLGCWDQKLAQALADVDVLALEFNHDVEMEYASGREPRLIARVLGDEGHLSNDQAARFLREVLSLSTPGRLQHVVQLHLSRDCNRPALAAAAAREVLNEQTHEIEVHTARQDRPSPVLHVGGTGNGSTRPRGRAKAITQAWLPGLEA